MLLVLAIPVVCQKSRLVSSPAGTSGLPQFARWHAVLPSWLENVTSWHLFCLAHVQVRHIFESFRKYRTSLEYLQKHQSLLVPTAALPRLLVSLLLHKLPSLSPRKWERSARESPFICGQAASFSCCLTRVQQNGCSTKGDQG